MTKKDYELIAASIARTLSVADMVEGSALKRHQRQAKREALRLVAIDLAASLANENPRFDRSRFLLACGF